MKLRGPLLLLVLSTTITAACGDKTGDTGDASGSDGGSADGGAGDGGGGDGGSADGGASDGGAGDGGSTTADWVDMTREERQKYMNDAVLPAMTELFQAQDPTRYAKMDCSLCHGQDFWESDVDYAMPNDANADATRIGDGAPGVISWSGGSGDYATFRDDFMPNVVLPAMAELLGVEPRSESNPDGLSCAACHPTGG